jgi:hypothetical protein
MRLGALALVLALTAGASFSWGPAPELVYSGMNLDGTMVGDEAVPTPPEPDTLPAFPEAQGWGATALATCRDLPLQVLQVTSTDASGSGTLKNAVESLAHPDSFTVIVFRVGGAVVGTANNIHIATGSANRCMYVAGQTAPGMGFALQATTPGRLLRVGDASGSPRGRGVAIHPLSWGRDGNGGAIHHVR